MELKFYKCSVCGQIISVINNTGMPVICCGLPMEEIIPGSVDASGEKHVPICVVDKDKVVVTVGSVLHPMEEKHYIEWIAIQTKNGQQYKTLKPGDMPKACFTICEDDKVEAVYAYCNLHSLWKG